MKDSGRKECRCIHVSHLWLQFDVIDAVAFSFRKLHHKNPQQRQSMVVQELLQARWILGVLGAEAIMWQLVLKKWKQNKMMFGVKHVMSYSDKLETGELLLKCFHSNHESAERHHLLLIIQAFSILQ